MYGYPKTEIRKDGKLMGWFIIRGEMIYVFSLNGCIKSVVSTDDDKRSLALSILRDPDMI